MTRRRHVHLVRHAEVENPERVVYGLLPGFFLSARGRAQAAETAERLAATVRERVAMVASPLERAQETAGIIAQRLGIDEIATDPLLTEASAGLEGLPYQGRVLNVFRRALDARARARVEAPPRVALRMAQAIRAALASTPGEVVIVSHQFPIRMGRVAIERRIGRPGATRFATALPWLFARGRCELGSITSLAFGDDEELVELSYWSPAAAARAAPDHR